jgi:nucleoid-associated protein YgaU
MSGHEWTHESHPAGPVDASMTPDGPDQTPDDDAPAVVRSRRFPRISFDVRGLSLNRFRRKPRPDPATAVDVDGPAVESSETEAPRPRSGRINWSRLPLASARRETRVGIAALASFLILVIALILNRSPDRPAVPMNIGGDSATKGANESPEKKNAGPKEGAGTGTAAVAAQTSPTPAKDATKNIEQATPPVPTEPIARTGHDLLTKPEDPKTPATKPDPPPIPPAIVAVKKPDETAAPPAPAPAPVAITKPDEKTDQPAPSKSGSIEFPETVPDLPTLPSATLATPAGPDAKAKAESSSLPPVIPPPVDTAKSATPPPISTPTSPTLPPISPSVDLPSLNGNEPPANAPAALPGEPSSIKTGDLAAPPRLPVDQPAPDLKKDADVKGVLPPPSPALIGGTAGSAPEPKTTAPTNPTPPSSLPKAADDLPPIAVPPATPKPPDEVPFRTEPVPAPVQPKPLPAAPAEHLNSTPAEMSPKPKVPELTAPPVSTEAEPPSAAVASPGSRTIRTLGKFRPLESGSETQLAANEIRVADAPLRREPDGAREQVDPILHTVQRSENFWTISRSYYGSGRYYKALHAANVKLVPVISELYVGTTIKVPPVESLDRSLFDPPSRASVADVASTRDMQVAASARTPRPEDGRAVPSRPRVDVELGMPTTRPKRAGVRDEVDEPTRPTYRVRAHDTLRSIARDTLGDSHRYREILDLNRDVIDDPTRLVSGQTLTLPEDAIVRERPR